MRHLALALALVTLVLTPRGAGHARGLYRVATPRPLFGVSVRLLDPSRYPADDPQYAYQSLPDAEPAVAIAPDGTVWVAAIHMQHGTALWRGRFGSAVPTFAGMPDHGIGGDDVALAAGLSVPSNLYVASLARRTAPVEAWRIATTSCPAGVVTPRFAPCVFAPHLAYGRRDRPWLAAYGRSTVYLSYLTRGGALLAGHMTVHRSDDGGRSWRVVGDPVAALPTGLHGWPGNLAVDQRNGRVYEVFVTQTPGQGATGNRFNRLMVALSRDGGLSWRDVTVYQGQPGEDDANMWPSLAIDAAGGLYVTWSDRRHVYLARSLDGAATWSTAWRVDTASPSLHARVMPSVAAGAAGRVALAWYGADTSDNLSARAGWRVMYAASNDGGRSFAQVAATGVIHRGPVCAKGDACPWEQRQLLDLLGLALDPRSGRAAIAYSRSLEFGDYRGCRRAANCPQTYYVEETAH